MVLVAFVIATVPVVIVTAAAAAAQQNIINKSLITATIKFNG